MKKNQPLNSKIILFFTVLLSAFLTMQTTKVNASHFRGGSISWSQVSGNTVRFTVTTSWGGFVSNPILDFGDGTLDLVPHVQVSSGPGYVTYQGTIEHTYATSGPYTVFFQTCCRIINLQNAPEASFRLETVVCLTGNTGSPVSSVPAIVQMIASGQSFQLPAADPDGDQLIWSWATTAQTGIPTNPPAGFTISPTGLLTLAGGVWSAGQQFALALNVTEGAGGCGAKTVVDFIVQIQAASGNLPPTCVLNGNATNNINVGEPFSISFTGTDPEGLSLTANASALPPGATIGPLSGGSPLTTTFNYTPAQAQANQSFAITLTYVDAGGLTSLCSFSLNVGPGCEAPAFSACPSNISVDNTPGQCGAIVTYPPAMASGTAPITITYSHNSGTFFPVGTTTVTATATNDCGTKTCSFTVTVNDTESPSITCPSNITLSACESTASWTTPAFSDNCPGATVVQTAGPASGSTFDNGTTATITYTVTDASNNSTSCSFTVSRATALSASSSATAILCNGGTSTVTVSASGGTAPYTGTGTFTTTAGNYSYTVTDANGCTATTTGTIVQPTALVATCSRTNPSMYFGFTGDQSGFINAKATGGVAPYTISITMDRPLNCNVITSSGDELWTAASGTSYNNECPASGPGLIPVSTVTGMDPGEEYSVNVTLMQDAIFTATITDANGCVTTCTTTVHAEDARCFAGNSVNGKITICHQTGSTNNPCVKICVDESAVAAHFAHGDFLGNCTPNCVAPIYNTRQANFAVTEVITPSEFNVKASPNPTGNQFTLVVEGNSNEKINLVVFDASGRIVKKIERGNTLQPIYFGKELKAGVYFVELRQGENRKTIKLVKQ